MLARPIQLQGLHCTGPVVVGVLGTPLVAMEELAVVEEGLELVADLTVQAVALH